jgi:tRNA(fMet)-specific endonuclease VapC
VQFLLDTDISIAIMKGNVKTLEYLARTPRESLFVSSVSIYELFTGVAKCSKPLIEQAKVEKLTSCMQVVSFDSDSAKRAAVIRANLEARGEMIGPYDVLIAAQAVAHCLSVVTRNVREFARVETLKIIDWTK